MIADSPTQVITATRFADRREPENARHDDNGQQGPSHAITDRVRPQNHPKSCRRIELAKANLALAHAIRGDECAARLDWGLYEVPSRNLDYSVGIVVRSHGIASVGWLA